MGVIHQGNIREVFENLKKNIPRPLESGFLMPRKIFIQLAVKKLGWTRYRATKYANENKNTL